MSTFLFDMQKYWKAGLQPQARNMKPARAGSKWLSGKSAKIWRAQQRNNLRSSGIRLARNGAQAFEIVQNDMPALAGNHPFFLEAGKDAGDGFFGDAQIIADVAARHAQIELGRRVIAHRKTPRQRQQVSR